MATPVVTSTVAMALSEAQGIADIVFAALQDTNHRHHPVSLLRGYDIFQIDKAFKLLLANEFLLFAGREDFEQRWRQSVEFWSPGLSHITRFVYDDQADADSPKRVWDFFDPSFLTLENMASFARFCESVGASDPLYWQKVYTRIGARYTAYCPQGNSAVFPGDENPTEFVFQHKHLWWLLAAIGAAALIQAFR